MKSLVPIEYATQRILTTEQVAEFYGTSEEIILQNFKTHKEHFVEGKHYFKIANEALNMLKAKNPCLQISTENSLYLWTKRGCSCHANFLEGFEALDKFEWLEENYFDTEEKQLQIYSNEDFGKIRGVMIDNEPYFVGKDIADALGYKDTSQAIRVNVDDEDKLTRTLYASGQRREMKLINESGLYSLILSSKLPAAKKFKRWVTSEVLPSIRKTGEYSQNNFSKNISQINKPSEMINEIGNAKKAIQSVFGVKDGIALANATNIIGKFYGHDFSELKALIPPAEHNTGYMNATQLSKKVGKTVREINQLLKDYGLQYKDGKDWRLTAKGKEFGEEFPYDAGKHSGYQIRWGSPTVELFLEDVVH